MKKLAGALLVLAGLVSLIMFFAAPNQARLARQADSGGIAALSAQPEKILLLAGVALLAGGAAMLKRS
jgi:hypothetical protein